MSDGMWQAQVGDREQWEAQYCSCGSWMYLNELCIECRNRAFSGGAELASRDRKRPDMDRYTAIPTSVHYDDEANKQAFPREGGGLKWKGDKR